MGASTSLADLAWPKSMQGSEPKVRRMRSEGMVLVRSAGRMI